MMRGWNDLNYSDQCFLWRLAIAVGCATAVVLGLRCLRRIAYHQGMGALPFAIGVITLVTVFLWLKKPDRDGW